LQGHDSMMHQPVTVSNAGFGSLYSIELQDCDLSAARLQAQCGLSVSRRVSMSRKGAEWREGVSARLISELYRSSK
jgi:hypothetical protein